MRVYVDSHFKPAAISMQIWNSSNIEILPYEEAKDLHSKLGACIDTIEANRDTEKGVSE